MKRSSKHHKILQQLNKLLSEPDQELRSKFYKFLRSKDLIEKGSGEPTVKAVLMRHVSGSGDWLTIPRLYQEFLYEQPCDLAKATFEAFRPYINVLDYGEKVFDDIYVKNWLGNDCIKRVAEVRHSIMKRERANYRAFYSKDHENPVFEIDGKLIKYNPYNTAQEKYRPELVDQHIEGRRLTYYTSGQNGLALFGLDGDAHRKYQEHDVKNLQRVVSIIYPDALFYDSFRGFNGLQKARYIREGEKLTKVQKHIRMADYNTKMADIAVWLTDIALSLDILSDIEVKGTITHLKTIEKSSYFDGFKQVEFLDECSADGEVCGSLFKLPFHKQWSLEKLAGFKDQKEVWYLDLWRIAKAYWEKIADPEKIEATRARKHHLEAECKEQESICDLERKLAQVRSMVYEKTKEVEKAFLELEECPRQLLQTRTQRLNLAKARLEDNLKFILGKASDKDILDDVFQVVIELVPDDLLKIQKPDISEAKKIVEDSCELPEFTEVTSKPKYQGWDPNEPDAFVRTHDALLPFCREFFRANQTFPRIDQALEYLKEYGFYSGAWEVDLGKRTQRVKNNLKYIAKSFDNEKLGKKLDTNSGRFFSFVRGRWQHGVKTKYVEQSLDDDFNVINKIEKDFYESSDRLCAWFALFHLVLVQDPAKNGRIPQNSRLKYWCEQLGLGWDRLEFHSVFYWMKKNGFVDRDEYYNVGVARKYWVGDYFPKVFTESYCVPPPSGKPSVGIEAAPRKAGALLSLRVDAKVGQTKNIPISFKLRNQFCSLVYFDKQEDVSNNHNTNPIITLVQNFGQIPDNNGAFVYQKEHPPPR